MPFSTITLNDGRKIPEIGFGTWKVPQDSTEGEVDVAIQVGFDHIDTAQTYRNETEAGLGIKHSGLSRKEIWVTTKWSGTDGKGIRQSCMESLEKLGIEYIDLYLIHNPRITNGHISATWREMESLQKEGYVKSIGVSNYSVSDLKELLSSSRVAPAVNQILLQPYVIRSTTPLLEFMAERHIVPEGYSTLFPLTSQPGGPVDKPVNEIAKRLNAQPEQILLAWSRAKKAIILTTSSRKDRLERYLDVGDIKLTDDDVAAIDKAGSQGEQKAERKAMALTALKWTAVAGLTGWALVRML